MDNNELINYIKSTADSGQSIFNIRTALQDAGYSDADITTAIMASGISAQQPNMAPAPLPAQISEDPDHSAPFGSKRKSILIALGAIFFLLLFGGSVFAYVSISKSSHFGTTLLYDAIANQKNIHTMHMQSNLDATLQSTSTPGFTGIAIDSIVDTRPTSNTNTDSNITVRITNPHKQTPFLIKFRIIHVNGIMYIKLLDITTALIPNLAYEKQFTDAEQQLLNKWFNISPKGLVGLAQSFSTSQNMQQQIDGAQRARSDIYALFMKSRLFVVSKDLGTDTVGSVSTYHYKLSVDTKAAAQFFSSALQIVQRDMPSTPITDNEVTRLKDTFYGLVTILNQPNITDMEIWISKSTHRITKVSLAMTLSEKTLINTPGLSSAMYDDIFSAQGNKKLSLSFNSILTDQNIPVNISAPVQSTSLIQYLSNMTIARHSLSAAKEEGNTAAVQSNLDAASTEGALYYSSGNNYGAARSSVHGGVCADPSVSISLQNIKQITGTKPVCTTNAKRYSPASSFTIYAKTANGHYFCIDSSSNLNNLDIGTSLSSYRAGISCK